MTKHQQKNLFDATTKKQVDNDWIPFQWMVVLRIWEKFFCNLWTKMSTWESPKCMDGVAKKMEKK